MPDTLAGRLSGLVRRELLVVETDPRSPGRGQHAFIQSIIREVAYATLSRRDRRTRHVAAARYFESLGDEELAGVLATHYIAAYRAAPEGPEGAAIAAQARIALRAAADRAEALGAIGQAIDALRSALEVTADRTEHPAILVRISSLEADSARYEEADRDSVAAHELAIELGDDTVALHAVASRASHFASRGLIVESLAIAESAAPLAEALKDVAAARPARAWYAEVRARALFRSERFAEVLPWADEALALGDPLRLDFVVAMAMITKGSALCLMNRRYEGLALLNGAHHDATAHGHHIAALRAGNNLSSFLGDTDPRTALQWARSGITLARRFGQSTMDTYHAGNYAYSARRTGEWDAARDAIAELLDASRDEAGKAWLENLIVWLDVWRGADAGGRPSAMIEAAEASGDAQHIVNALVWSFEVAFVAGDTAAANQFGQRILDHDAGSPHIRFACGRMALHDGDRPTAERALARIQPSLGGACDGDVAALKGGLAAMDGRPDDAVRDYRSALTVYGDLGLRFDVAMTTLDMASFVGPSHPAVRIAADEAKEILRELRATPLLDRLERLMADGSAVAPGRPGVVEVGVAAERRSAGDV